jgi:hypothetical protein
LERETVEREHRTGSAEPPTIDFAIIGSAKCGTTSLHQYLAMHPDIFLPMGVGINNETGLFLPNTDQKIKSMTNRRIRRNLDDFALRELIFRKYSGQKVVGEESTDYTKRPFRTVEFDTMTRLNPEMKFIFIIRDPVEKLFSQYKHFLRYQPRLTEGSLTDELLSDEYYGYASAYFYQLEPYLHHFGQRSVHVLLLEDLARDPTEQLDRICSFLGIQAHPAETTELKRYNVNARFKDRAFELDEIPLSVRKFIAKDTLKLQEHLGQDLLSKWPKVGELIRMA